MKHSSYRKVLKFGGTSMASVSRRDCVAEIVDDAAREAPIVVVVSALAGVTDALYAAIDAARSGEEPDHVCAALLRRHLAEDPSPDVYAEIVRRIDALHGALAGVALLGECPAAVRDRILATGERLSAPLLAEALRRRGAEASAVDASNWIVARRTAGEAIVDFAATANRLNAWTRQGETPRIVVVGGFVAGDEKGRTITLGRGASDYSATILGAALGVERVEIWTDVDGVLSAEPRLVESPRVLSKLSYGEAGELARFGAKVIHPHTLKPLAQAGIPLIVRNTLRPENPGTAIELDGAADDVAAVTSTPCRRFVLNRPNLRGRVYDALERLAVEPLFAAHRSLVLTERDADALEIELGDELRVGASRCDDLAAVAAIGGRRGARLLEDLLGVLNCGEIEVREAVLPEDGTSVAALVRRSDASRAVELMHGYLRA